MKFKGKAAITDPLAVKAFAGAMAIEKGTIFVECPEKGFVGQNLIPCRYGLSFPYLTIPVGATLWIEPSIPPDERWIYTGFADCGGEAMGITPNSLMEMILMGNGGWKVEATKTGFLISFGTNIININTSEMTFTVATTELAVDVIGTKSTTITGSVTVDNHQHPGPSSPPARGT